jgi:hypothetical protein
MAAQVKWVLYLYGVSEALTADPIQQLGVGQGAIEALVCGPVMCWISQVPGVEFEQHLPRNMENLDWLAGASVSHQQAMAAIAEKVDILPARFGTVFRNEGSLRRHVLRHLRELRHDFKRLKGADEWGVKVFAAKTHLGRGSIRTGKEYLLAKAALLPKRRTEVEGTGEFSRFEQALGRVAIESTAPGSISSGQPGLRFQTTILVRRSDRKKLESLLTRFSRRWAEERTIECTGPWPPYSFVSRARESAGSK